MSSNCRRRANKPWSENRKRGPCLLRPRAQAPCQPPIRSPGTKGACTLPPPCAPGLGSERAGDSLLGCGELGPTLPVWASLLRRQHGGGEAQVPAAGPALTGPLSVVSPHRFLCLLLHTEAQSSACWPLTPRPPSRGSSSAEDTPGWVRNGGQEPELRRAHISRWRTFMDSDMF